MDMCTFGDSKGAINLMTTLQREEYSCYRPRVSAILGKFFQSTGGIVEIPNKTLREAILKMWHDSFVDKIACLDLPEVIKHTRFVY